jgi:ankyrin repeat protein
MYLQPKSKEQIEKDLAMLSKKELNKLLLDTACEGLVIKVMYLLDAEADIEAKDNYGQTLLMLASMFGYKNIVQILKNN